MADAHEEDIPQLVVDTSKTTSVDGQTLADLLDDENLLREILLCLGFPTTLVCAALVCKRWLCHVSDRGFLSLFRKRHPPRLLGLYIEDKYRKDPRVAARFFLILPQPPELAAVIRRSSFSLQTYRSTVYYFHGCRNGSGIIHLCKLRHTKVKVGVHNPFCPERGLAVTTPFPDVQIQDGYFCSRDAFHSVQEADGLSVLRLFEESNKERTKFMLHAYMLRHGGGVWRVHHTLVTSQHQLPYLQQAPSAMLADNKIYMPKYTNAIVVLDLTAPRISTIQLPQGVENSERNTMFARADDACSLYLFHAEKLQLCICLLKGDSWLLLDSICLHEMCTNLGMPDCTDKDEHTPLVRINHVGDNAECVILQIARCVFFLDIKCRTLRKVHELTETDPFLCFIHPFMMIWPPTFPAPKDDPARDAM